MSSQSGGPQQWEAQVLEAMQQLSPEERRRIQRYLRTVGLVAGEELLTDRNRLQVAPALGLQYRALRRRQQRAQSSMARFVAAQPAEPQAEVPAVPVHRSGDAPPQPEEDYRSPVSGKVVVGAPGTEAPLEPHAMAPLPGQAPEQRIVVIFDGGSRGNPGQGYGSYALRWPGQAQQIVQLRFGDKVTNNEAEYDTLIAALEAVLKRLKDSGAAPATASLEARGDSLLVVDQVLGAAEVKEPRLHARRQRVRDLLEQFGHWRLVHHTREHSVRTLGH
jgi:ribonuclease HI